MSARTRHNAPKPVIEKVLAKQVAARTQDAYSRDWYTDAGWLGVARRLAEEGLNATEIEWVLRSKHMRWAADYVSRSHSVRAADFIAYTLENGGFEKLARDVRNNAKHDLPATPASGADLAGACEGEDIAELIDLARQVATLRFLIGGGPTPEATRASEILARIEARAK